MIGIIQSDSGSTDDRTSAYVTTWVVYIARQLLLLHDMCYVYWGVSCMVMPCCYVKLNIAFLKVDISGWSDCAFRITLVVSFSISLQKAPSLLELIGCLVQQRGV